MTILLSNLNGYVRIFSKHLISLIWPDSGNDLLPLLSSHCAQATNRMLVPKQKRLVSKLPRPVSDTIETNDYLFITLTILSVKS